MKNSISSLRSTFASLIESLTQIPGFPLFSPLATIARQEKLNNQNIEPTLADPLNYSISQFVSMADRAIEIAARSNREIAEPIELIFEAFAGSSSGSAGSLQKIRSIAKECKTAIGRVEWDEWNSIVTILASAQSKIPKN